MAGLEVQRALSRGYCQSQFMQCLVHNGRPLSPGFLLLLSLTIVTHFAVTKALLIHYFICSA